MSITILGLIVGAISLLMKNVGIELGTEQITNFLTTGGQLIAGIMIYWGRIRKGDLTFWGTRKPIPPSV